MNVTRTLCAYCRQPRTFSTGWHDCPQAAQARARLNAAIEGAIAIGAGHDRKPKLLTK